MGAPPDPEFRLISEAVAFEGAIFDVTSTRWQTPDGDEIDRDVIRHPGAVGIVAVDDDGAVVLVRQFRAALGSYLTEIPAGKRDVPGEDPVVCARRELAEEVGLEAGSIELLACVVPAVGFCDEEITIYLATDLTAVPFAPDGAEEHHMEILRVPLTRVDELWVGAPADAKTVIGLMLARDRLRSNG